MFIGAFLLGVPILSLLYGIDISSYKTLLMLIIAGGVLYSFSTLLSAALTTIRYTFIQFYCVFYNFNIYILFFKIINSISKHLWSIIGLSCYYDFPVFLCILEFI